MRRLRKLLALPACDRRLLFQAWAVLLLVRLGLSLLRFRRLRSLLDAANRRVRSGRPRSLEEVGWAVTTAARVVPSATCLVQALTAQALLARRGQPTELRFGVTRPESAGKLEAHAWLERDGRVVFGDPRPGHYHPLRALGASE